MSERELIVGDWVRARETFTSITGDAIEAGAFYRVAAFDGGGWPILHTDKNGGGGWNPKGFRRYDPLDEAIVDAATQWNEYFTNGGQILTGADERLKLAIQAKLNANKPKTAEQVIEAFFNDYELRDSLGDLAFPEEPVDRLRSAGLLREDSES